MRRVAPDEAPEAIELRRELGGSPCWRSLAAPCVLPSQPRETRPFELDVKPDRELRAFASVRCRIGSRVGVHDEQSARIHVFKYPRGSHEREASLVAHRRQHSLDGVASVSPVLTEQDRRRAPLGTGPMRPALEWVSRTADLLWALTESDLRFRYGRGPWRFVRWLLEPV